MSDAWRAYLELALGASEASKKRAQKVAKRLVGKSGATAAQVQTLAEDLLAAGTANREAITKLVRFEVDRALGVVGLATVEEVDDLTKRVHDLERELREARSRAAAAEAGTTAAPAPAKKAVAKKTTPTKAAAPASPQSPAKSTVAKKAVAKKAPAKAREGAREEGRPRADDLARHGHRRRHRRGRQRPGPGREPHAGP